MSPKIVYHSSDNGILLTASLMYSHFIHGWRQQLFRYVDAVIGKHIIERPAEQRPHGVARQRITDQHHTIVSVQ